MSDEKLNTNMRSLKRIPGPDKRLIYTLENKSEQGKAKLLCEHCGARTPAGSYPACDVHESLRRHQDAGIKLLVRTCPQFEPLLTFRPPLRGFMADFNTFRLGTAWYYRIGVGVRAALVDTLTCKVFAKAVVTSVEQGPLDQMCREHAHNNHAMLEFEPHEAAARMKKLIRQSYGLIEISDDSPITVIYLRNLDAVAGASTEEAPARLLRHAE